MLIASLMAADLIDEYLLFIHPLVLGSGRRLFPEGVEVALRLVHGVITPAGMVIATYEPVRERTWSVEIVAGRIADVRERSRGTASLSPGRGQVRPDQGCTRRARDSSPRMSDGALL